MRILFLLILSFQLCAQELIVATASNFKETLLQIIDRYERQSNIDVILVSGSTGGLFSQIQNGAPYDIFFSANKRHPELLVASGFAEASSVETYVQGKLVFIVNDDFDAQGFQNWLKWHPDSRIVLANPKTAPYGFAAKQVLENLNEYHSRNGNLIFSGNANKVLHILETGNGSAGFAPLSTVHSLGKTSFWTVPDYLYKPIIQDMVLLNRSIQNREAWDFFYFIKTPGIQNLLLDAGYKLPEK